jgi:hypothetical protein
MNVTTDMTSGGGITMANVGPYIYCIIPLSDYGSQCSSSDECEGECEYFGIIPDSCIESSVGIYTCPEEVYGSCSKTKSDCINGRIVEGNVIEQHICLYEISLND